jgi:hypothetical protein
MTEQGQHTSNQQPRRHPPGRNERRNTYSQSSRNHHGVKNPLVQRLIGIKHCEAGDFNCDFSELSSKAHEKPQKGTSGSNKGICVVSELLKAFLS